MNLLLMYYSVVSVLLLSPSGVLTNNTESYTKINDTGDFCQSWGQVNALAVKISQEHEYVKRVYDCTQFSRALLDKLIENGCSAQLVTGWYGEKGTQRGWHRWVQTPYFSIDATPSGAGIIIDISIYQKSYVSPMNFSYEIG